MGASSGSTASDGGLGVTGGAQGGDGAAIDASQASVGGAGSDAGSDAAVGPTGGLQGQLTIYFIDVEGGHATLIVFPNEEVMLIDSGFGGNRDPVRILDVLDNVIGADVLDYFLVTHYDADHVGGAEDVADGIDVGLFLDHGDDSAPSSYLELANAGDRRVIAAGEVLDVGDVHFDFVSSARQLIDGPLPGAGAENPYCEGAEVKTGDDENSASVGSILRFGQFDFLNLADLLWNLEHELVCPVNLLGTVDLYLTTHHGLERSGAPQMVRALEPLAAVMNNGPRKGGGGQTWETLVLAPGGGEVWQLHEALGADAGENPPEDQIANPGSGMDEAHWLRVSVDAAGSFTIYNPRNDFSKTYQAR